MNNKDIVEKLFKSILSNFSNYKNCYIHEVNKKLNKNDEKNYDHCEDGDILFFESEEDYKQGYMEQFSINAIQKAAPGNEGFLFCYRVDDPGVMYHRDGSGTPPSSDMIEAKGSYDTINECTIALIKFIIEIISDSTIEAVEEE